MAISNFSQLKEAVQDWAGRSDERFVNQLPNFVALAEQRIYFGTEKDPVMDTEPVRVRQMEEELSLTAEEQGESDLALDVVLPANFLSLRRLYLKNDYSTRFIQLSPQEFWTDSRVMTGATTGASMDTPRPYTIEANHIHMALGEGTVEALIYKRFDALAQDSDTNWLLENAPGVYFNASLAEAWRFSRNVERQTEALTTYAGDVAGLNKSERNARRDGSQMSPQTVKSRTDRR